MSILPGVSQGLRDDDITVGVSFFVAEQEGFEVVLKELVEG